MPLSNELLGTLIKAQEQQAVGKTKLALATYQKAVAGAKKGTEEEFVAVNLLGQFYDDVQAPDLAVASFRRAQKLAVEIFGEASVQLAIATGNESMVYLNRGDQKKGAGLINEAAKLLRACDRAKIAALSPHMISGPVSVLCNAAAINMNLGNVKDAVAIARDAFAIAEQCLSVTDPTYVQAGFELCMHLKAAGLKKEEVALRDKLTNMLLLQGNHPEQLMATLAQAFGNMLGENTLVDGSDQEMFDSTSRGSSLAPAGVQLKITLNGVKPPVWRRITVETDVSLYGLHQAIQQAMGWTDSHLHEFYIGRYRFGDSSGDSGVNEESDCALEDIDLRVGTKFTYMYDFGDGWKHTIEVEKWLSEDEIEEMPVFVKAKGACPPEDCGGPYGYMELLDALKDGAAASEDMREWLEEMDLIDFDPTKVPSCFEEVQEQYQEKISSKTKTKATPKATSKNTIESVGIAPEPVKPTAKKKTGKLEWPGAR
jgi:tetratricopeptide (TPR) repeat protein